MKKLIVFLGVILVIGIGIVAYLMMQPDVEEVAYTLYDEDQIKIVLDDEMIDISPSPSLINNVIYFPFEFIDTYVDDDFFLEEEVQILTYTTSEHVYKVKAGENQIEVDGHTYALDNSFLWQDDTMYIPVDFVVTYFNFAVDYRPIFNFIVMDSTNGPITTGRVREEETYLYNTADETSEVLLTLEPDEELRVFQYDYSKIWVKVRSEDGIIGFVKRDKMEHISMNFDQMVMEYDERVNTRENITMVWHQVFNQTANDMAKESFSNTVGLEVISPTWFSLNDNGGLNSIASHSYVNWAHSEGYEVWPLIDNQFDSSLTHEVLSNPEKRQNLIDDIVDSAVAYNVDGINIDFESVGKDTGPYYVQFIKELAPTLRRVGITLSVDVYVPSAWTSHYERDELAEFADYIAIMGYDEHWSGSEEAGSVSSIGFVENAIVNTLKEVPADKIILGVPYYTRLWGEELVDGQLALTSKALGMESAANRLEENNAEITWLEDVGQYYGEYTIDNKTYKIWLEDTRSLEEKFKLVKEYDIAGISAWKKNLESDDVWPLIDDYFEK
ncbi:glycosyl hydrolase family 18 protein [Vallitalea okinawensis]|uniref:glycosyl hydrolase family 18 protein n=1 Tax=Vallitalea okinawensis TaxID=2078660 RepID=UPI000CFD4F36|nr:glycosyl hydrolase family 18 protein [Vallitalea okinawensis]